MEDKRGVELRAQVLGTMQALQAGEYVKNEVKKLSRTAKQFVSTFQASHEAAVKFHSELQSFGFNSQQKDEHIAQCGIVLAQLEALSFAMVNALTTAFVDQVDKLIQSEEKISITDAKDKLSASRRQVDSAYRKLLEHKAEKTELDPKLQKNVDDSVKNLEELISEGTKKAEQWDKAARHELTSALTGYMKHVFNSVQKSTACMKGWDARVEDRMGSIAIRGVIPPPEKQEPPPIKQGYLFVRVGTETSWNLRWFVLEAPQAGGNLKWFKSWHSSSPSTNVDCALLSVRPQSDEQKHRGCLDLHSPRIMLQVKGLSKQDAEEWLEAIKGVIAVQLANAGSNHPLASRVDPSKNGAILQSLRDADAANNVCVDCGATAPEWAAVNHGVLICIECSGIHRSLGTHVSKVRSVTLDNWEPESVEVMKLIGNERANAVWEKFIPENYRKPQPTSKHLLKEVYISCKWVERLFVEKSEKTPTALVSELAEAVQRNQVSEAARLVAMRADVNALIPDDKQQRRLLHVAAASGSGEMVEFLLQNSGDPMLVDTNGDTPLLVAVKAGNLSMSALLFARVGGSLARDKLKLVEAAQQSGNAALVTLVNDKLASAESRGQSPRGLEASTSSPRERRNTDHNNNNKTVSIEKTEKEKEKEKERAESPTPQKEKEKEKEKQTGGRLLKRFTSLRNLTD